MLLAVWGGVYVCERVYVPVHGYVKVRGKLLMSPSIFVHFLVEIGSLAG